MHSKPCFLNKLLVADASNNCPTKAVAHIRYGFTSVINEASNTAKAKGFYPHFLALKLRRIANMTKKHIDKTGK